MCLAAVHQQVNELAGLHMIPDSHTVSQVIYVSRARHVVGCNADKGMLSLRSSCNSVYSNAMQCNAMQCSAVQVHVVGVCTFSKLHMV